MHNLPNRVAFPVNMNLGDIVCFYQKRIIRGLYLELLPQHFPGDNVPVKGDEFIGGVVQAEQLIALIDEQISKN